MLSGLGQLLPDIADDIFIKRYMIVITGNSLFTNTVVPAKSSRPFGCQNSIICKQICHLSLK
jgi:hypothetical protein